MGPGRYRRSLAERRRTEDLLKAVAEGGRTALEVGARDGLHSAWLTGYFESVIALDIEPLRFRVPRVTNVQGDVTSLCFRDDCFDAVICAEVLEHVRDVEKACQEVVRVAKRSVVIGVPYRQDLRVGQTTCRNCGRTSPPWGHLHSFDERRLKELFPALEIVSTSFVCEVRRRTNPVSAWLMGLAGNPWGSYDQQEPCVHCGRKLEAPARRTFVQRVASAIATRLDKLQNRLARPRPAWIHVVLAKPNPSERCRSMDVGRTRSRGASASQ